MHFNHFLYSIHPLPTRLPFKIHTNAYIKLITNAIWPVLKIQENPKSFLYLHFKNKTKYDVFGFWKTHPRIKATIGRFGEGKSFSLGRSSNRKKYFIKTTISWHTNISNTTSSIVIVDEIQKIPELLDEVHWLIENHQVRFILSGSSPRKILRSNALRTLPFNSIRNSGIQIVESA